MLGRLSNSRTSKVLEGIRMWSLFHQSIFKPCRQIFSRNGLEDIFDPVSVQWARPNDVLEVPSGSTLLQFL